MRTRTFAAWAALAAAGCGGGTKPVPVAGVVTLDGAPLAQASLLFESPDGSGRPGSAATGPDGRFTAATNAGIGLFPGAYRVVVMVADSSPAAAPAQDVAIDSPEYAKMMAAAEKKPAEPAKPRMPAKYSDPKATTLLVDVPADGNSTVELKLSSK